MKNKGFIYQHSVEKFYNAAREKMEKLKKIEAERCLEDGEEIEKKEALDDIKYYGDLLAEEIEQERQEICRSQGLSRWC